MGVTWRSLELGRIGETIRLGTARKASVKHRIVMWTGLGFLVAIFWGFYFAIVPVSSAQLAWTLARVTCPIAFASFYFDFPIRVYWSVLANGATYALVGLIVERLRPHLMPAK